MDDFDYSKAILNDLYNSQPRNKGHVIFGIRTVVRTAAALTEGIIYQLRLVCLAASEDYPSLYSLEEILALKQESVSLNEKGRIVTKVSYQSIQSSLVFVFAMFSKIQKIEVMIDKLDNRWGDFKDFIKIRNELMHPKSLIELEFLSDNDVDINTKNKKCAVGVSWFIDNYRNLMAECKVSDEILC
jgi:hypothetical protein